MDFLQMKHLKRKRKSNYSVKETQTLICEIHKRRKILFSRQQNMAINELKRCAWEEVADSVNALGEGELRTAAEVKRRYLDWRALMKRKQLQAKLVSGLKAEFEPSSPDNEVSLDGGEQSLDLSGFSKDLACDWQDLTDLGEPSTHSAGVKMEDSYASSYRFEADVGESAEGEEDDEDCFPSILPDMDREGHVPEVFAHIDEYDVLSSTKPSSGPAAGRDIGVGVGTVTGMTVAGLGLSGSDSISLLVALERQRLDLEKHRLQVESERLQVEKERLLVEKEKLRQGEVERERLQLEKERLQVERERLRLLVQQNMPLIQSPAPSTSMTTPTTSSSVSTSSSLDGEKDKKLTWPMVVDLEAEKLKLEKERLLLEKERLQFFKFESSRLQIEKECLQVEKERLQLQKDGQQMALHS
ncbi:myb/SANT-like DNA-binding domain-containing protein 4 [Myxocyprinus asiaticus]|uniref:myb/SANT-like DNA-binding domain-containing protein 4 n=1 Tax=Myxocyprinus asiaticus TaxID=70543 RepID=UPI002221F6C7|nr:myb/SANT-like DNA-binding domain-containing protein 4 [Myxocyprinus asiaticus]